MATITPDVYNDAMEQDLVHAGEYGNESVKHFSVNKSAALNDVVALGIMPAGSELNDLVAYVADAAANVTASFGWAYLEDGADDDNEEADADYFCGATAVHTGPTLIRKTSATPPKRLARDAYIIMTIGGGAQAAALQVNALVKYEWRGTL